jgi:predicted nucleic acid-binding protein
MNLIDAGPLVALNDQGDPFHHRCVAAVAANQPAHFATTWPCLAEAMHILGRTGGFPLQSALWRMLKIGLIEMIDLSSEEIALAEELMGKYQDHPMDLADATLVAVADLRGYRKIFTLDSHFFAFRLRDGGVLDLIIPDRQ